jgi:hypothetical protein
MKFLCRLGWHNIGINYIENDGKLNQRYGHCKRCGKKCIQDSQGGWF